MNLSTPTNQCPRKSSSSQKLTWPKQILSTVSVSASIKLVESVEYIGSATAEDATPIPWNIPSSTAACVVIRTGRVCHRTVIENGNIFYYKNTLQRYIGPLLVTLWQTTKEHARILSNSGWNFSTSSYCRGWSCIIKRSYWICPNKLEQSFLVCGAVEFWELFLLPSNRHWGGISWYTTM